MGIIALKNNKPAGHAPGLCGLGADPLTKGHACKKCQEGSTEAQLCECDEWYDAASVHKLGLELLPMPKFAWKNGDKLPAMADKIPLDAKKCREFFQKLPFGSKALALPQLKDLTDWSLGNCAADSASGASLEEVEEWTVNDYCGGVRDMIVPAQPSTELCAVLNLCPH